MVQCPHFQHKKCFELGPQKNGRLLATQLSLGVARKEPRGGGLPIFPHLHSKPAFRGRLQHPASSSSFQHPAIPAARRGSFLRSSSLPPGGKTCLQQSSAYPVAGVGIKINPSRGSTSGVADVMASLAPARAPAHSPKGYFSHIYC